MWVGKQTACARTPQAHGLPLVAFTLSRPDLPLTARMSGVQGKSSGFHGKSTRLRSAGALPGDCRDTTQVTEPILSYGVSMCRRVGNADATPSIRVTRCWFLERVCLCSLPLRGVSRHISFNSPDGIRLFFCGINRRESGKPISLPTPDICPYIGHLVHLK